VSESGPTKTSKTWTNSRANTHFLQKHPFLTSVSSVIDAFSDSGNWGITISGPNAKSGEMADVLTKEVQDLAKVTDEEVSRAKNIIKTRILQKQSGAEARIEALARNLVNFGESKDTNATVALINGVTADQVRAVAAKVIKSRPTLIVLGGEIHKVPSIDAFAARFK
jgi:processing peptidase subunit alpha